ncbi:MAG: tRNA (guanosine(37)-N1)-methyltransferase TrmD [bacterium]|nr:tRNA (guanosine(37)-N1)-methyltransferase TrmD [Candidatus Microgenomates bacterium CPR3]MCQ3944719.1 tRNA (guanosine(37)-N1)-methyltransferase TrmD [bacterium]RIK51860.1 MAG: tRNA (guanosine(37)-N1)-methyltransferase TrmD [Candidatus Microgenomates bacterium]
MRIDIITLFPEFFDGLKKHSIVGRAIDNEKVELHTHNLREWAVDSYGTVDDHPYGGGPGMVLKVDVMHAAIKAVKEKVKDFDGKVILLTPQGKVYKQKKALELAKEKNIILICGHYEGFDERIREYVDLEISVGDYVLTGGEIPAMILVDSVSRLLPGVLGDDASSHDESHSEGLLEYPQYTRPAKYDNKGVPEILLSGDHPKIDAWRKEQAIIKTQKRRPDLLKTK